MSKKLLAIVLLLGLFVSGYFATGLVYPQGQQGQKDSAARAAQPVRSPAAHMRIVSLAPSITEILFLLGLGEQVVGVTRFCTYPPEAKTKSIIGGYCDPNYEAVVALHPGLVIMLTEHAEPRRNLEKLGLKTLVVDHRNINGILNSITAIGMACGREHEALTVVGGLRVRMERVRHAIDGLARPRVMVTVGRNMGSGRIEDVYISGRGGFYSELITLAGGVNAYGGDIAYPSFSEEGIMRINPAVIIDMVPDLGAKALDKHTVISQWRHLSRVDAVRNSRVYVFGQDYTVIPGPRFIDLLEEMAWTLHPEVPWNTL